MKNLMKATKVSHSSFNTNSTVSLRNSMIPTLVHACSDLQAGQIGGAYKVTLTLFIRNERFTIT